MNDLKKVKIKYYTLEIIRILIVSIFPLFLLFFFKSIIVGAIAWIAGAIIYSLTTDLSIDFRVDFIYSSEEDKRKKFALLNNKPFVLFLRGFKSNSLNTLPANLYEIEGDKFTIPQPTILFHLSKAVNHIALPVALDIPKPGGLDWMPSWSEAEHFELGHTKMTYIPVDYNKDWRSFVESLAQKCFFIVIIPSNTDGIIEEIKIIQKNKLEYKTIVFMPYTSFEDDFTVEKEWQACQKSFKENMQLELPEYLPSGCMYIPNKKFSYDDDDVDIADMDNYKSFPVKLGKISLHNSLKMGFDNLIKHFPKQTQQES